jgi:hypothetical protein
VIAKQRRPHDTVLHIWRGWPSKRHMQATARLARGHALESKGQKQYMCLSAASGCFHHRRRLVRRGLLALRAPRRQRPARRHGELGWEARLGHAAVVVRQVGGGAAGEAASQHAHLARPGAPVAGWG